MNVRTRSYCNESVRTFSIEMPVKFYFKKVLCFCEIFVTLPQKLRRDSAKTSKYLQNHLDSQKFSVGREGRNFPLVSVYNGPGDGQTDAMAAGSGIPGGIHP